MKMKYTTQGGVDPIVCEKRLVIVGANGSGKSHLGAAIEKFNSDNTFRIMSQRAINIPKSLYIIPKDTEINLIQYGNEIYKNKGDKYSGYYDNYTKTYVDDYKNVITEIYRE